MHGYMTLLRFDTDSVEAKMACAGSLARLSERWSNDWSSLSVLSKVSAAGGKSGKNAVCASMQQLLRRLQKAAQHRRMRQLLLSAVSVDV